MRTLTIWLLVVLESMQPCLTRTITKSFHRYNYTWNEKLSPYNDLNPCREGFWTLEIYDVEVQKEVDGFIDHLLIKNASIGNQYVILNMFCENETECTWKNANERVTYFNWNVSNSINPNYNDTQIVYYLKATNQNKGHKHTWNKMFLDETNQTFARICMQGDKVETSTFYTETSPTLTYASKNNNQGDLIPTIGTLNTDSNTFNHEIYLAVAVVSLLFLVIIFGVVVGIIVRRKRQKYQKTRQSHSKSSYENAARDFKEPRNDVQSAAEQPLESTSNQNELQYADLNFTISNQSGNKKTEVEKNNCCVGPMGDIYSAVQK